MDKITNNPDLEEDKPEVFYTSTMHGDETDGYDTVAENSYVFTDPDTGDYHRLLLPGIYQMRFSADGFLTQELPFVMISAGDATRVDVVLQPLVSHTVTGLVTTPGVRVPVAGATVKLMDTLLPEVTTSGDGSYTITGVPESICTFLVVAAGYEILEADHEVTRFDFVLTPSELIFGDGSETGDSSAWSDAVE